jgi:hypothetical protein
MLAAVYLEHEKASTSADALRDGVPYLRVLGFTERGRALLARMKREATAPVVTNVGGAEAHPLLALDAAATAAYALGYEASTSDDWFADYYKPPIRVGFSGSDAR